MPRAREMEAPSPAATMRETSQRESGEPWHARAVAEVERTLDTSDAGLSSNEAARRLRALGANELPAGVETTWLTMLLRQLRDPLIAILLAAAAVTLALRDANDTIVILLVVVVNATVGLVQESRARKAMRSLARLAVPRAVAVRDGVTCELASRELVPGP